MQGIKSMEEARERERRTGNPGLLHITYTYIIIYRMPQVRDSSAFGGEAGEWREAGRSVRNKGKMARKEKHEKRGKKCLTRGMVCGILRKLSARTAENPLPERVERENKSKKI